MLFPWPWKSCCWSWISTIQSQRVAHIVSFASLLKTNPACLPIINVVLAASGGQNLYIFFIILLLPKHNFFSIRAPLSPQAETSPFMTIKQGGPSATIRLGSYHVAVLHLVRENLLTSTWSKQLIICVWVEISPVVLWVIVYTIISEYGSLFKILQFVFNLKPKPSVIGLPCFLDPNFFGLKTFFASKRIKTTARFTKIQPTQKNQ